jgi:hypothetical protein
MRFSMAAILASAMLSLQSSPARAQQPTVALPLAATRGDALIPLAAVPFLESAPLDLAALTSEDFQREIDGLPPRFALPQAVSLTPERDGVWEVLDGDTSVWRLVVAAPGAESLNLGFGRYAMPEGGRLQLYSADLEQVMRPFTARDNADHGELWTAILETDEIVVEVSLPSESRAALELELTSVNVGYRPFGKAAGEKSGFCNVDVVCPSGAGWEAEIASVGGISTGGSLFCTGFMVNNTAGDLTPYFQTADHCGIHSGNAASLVVYWNFETSCCGGTPDGQLDVFQTGAFFRAAHGPSDVTLVELDELPDPTWGVSYAGWDRSGANASSAVAVHHPSGDEKRISFENQPTTITSYFGTTVPGDGTHLRITDWDLGTTESGSSGSPLFDPNHRVIGQLHGGNAACGNNDSDWFGRFFVSWTGGGTPSTRLSDWLDPGSTGATTVDTLATSLIPSTVHQSWDLSSDPGWTTEGGWDFGVPAGGSGTSGGPDPTSGFTGSNVYGYELSGAYPNNLPETHLTSTAIDASQLADVHVSFQRWLNVEEPAFDHAYLRVSNDGNSWFPVWENATEITDACWREMTYDISGVADGESSVYLRWTMGATDSSLRFTGWNLDDVEIRAAPEPRMFWALPPMLALLGALARRRRR